MTMERKTRFEGRCERRLYRQALAEARQGRVGLSRVCERALEAFFAGCRDGRAQPPAAGALPCRTADDAAIHFEILLDTGLDTRLRHLALSLWVSRAEVLRRALLYYLSLDMPSASAL